jgi:hypothetical protein
MPSFLNASTTGSGGLIVFSDNSGILDFQTGNNLRMRITSNGGISFGASGTAYGSSGQLLVSAGDAAPQWTPVGSITAGNANTATNLAGGTAQSIPYQSSPGTTAFLAAASTSGWILTTNGTGSAPTWVNPTTAVSPSSLTVQANVSAFEYMVGVSSSGSSQNAYIATNSNSQIGFNASTGFIGMGTTVPISKLHINETGGVASQIRLEGHNNSGITFVTPSQINGAFVGFDGSGGFQIKQSTASLPIYFNLNGTTQFLVTGTGAVSFGGSSNFGTAGYYLQSNGSGSAPTWVSTSSQLVGNSTQVQTVAQASNANYYPTFVSANNASATGMNVYTTSSFVINPSTGRVGINGTPTFKFDVGINNQTQSATVGSNGLIRNATGADNTPYTQARIVVYGGTSVDTANWGYLAYGSDASLRIIYGKTAGGAPLIFGTSTAMDGTGTLTPTMTLSMAGALNVINEITAYSSDKRLKTDIRPIDNAIDKVRLLNGIIYKWNDLANSLTGYTTDEDLVGLFAQDVQEVLPQAVRPAPFDQENGASKSGENYLTVQYEKLVPLLVEAIKEQQAVIERQQKQIDQIQAMLAELLNK